MACFDKAIGVHFGKLGWREPEGNDHVGVA